MDDINNSLKPTASKIPLTSIRVGSNSLEIDVVLFWILDISNGDPDFKCIVFLASTRKTNFGNMIKGLLQTFKKSWKLRLRYQNILSTCKFVTSKKPETMLK